jgi:hypothetical protein
MSSSGYVRSMIGRNTPLSKRDRRCPRISGVSIGRGKTTLRRVAGRREWRMGARGSGRTARGPTRRRSRRLGESVDRPGTCSCGERGRHRRPRLFCRHRLGLRRPRPGARSAAPACAACPARLCARRAPSRAAPARNRARLPACLCASAEQRAGACSSVRGASGHNRALRGTAPSAKVHYRQTIPFPCGLAYPSRQTRRAIRRANVVRLQATVSHAGPLFRLVKCPVGLVGRRPAMAGM